MNEDEVQYISAESFQKFTDELKELKATTIPTIAKRIDEARQMGDLSENAEYHSAREEMAWAQTRVKEIEFILSNSQIISKPVGNNVVDVGLSITVKTKSGEKKYTIVGSQEADPLKGKISNESPLGQAFLGKKEGDKVSVKTPAGLVEYTITDIA